MKRRYRITALLTALLLLFACVPTHANGAIRYYGDINRDGTCATADVRDLLGFITDRTALDDEQLILADYDENGKVDSADARAILHAITSGAPLKPYVSANEQTLLSAAAYDGQAYVVLNSNMPLFTDADKSRTDAFEIYAPLDELGRCGEAYANLCTELMPTEDRESISSVTPTGWHNRQYDFVSGGWVYNRCHIIGFQLAGEQANKQNLITGTRYLNIEGMLPFENMIADYIKETDNHVLYRATPIFSGDNLLAEGVRMEAWSVEDNGEGICVHVFCYNVQPGVVFDYATGDNHADNEMPDAEEAVVYVLNTNSKKFHYPTCASASKISDQYREEYGGTRDELIADGYSPCGNCKP